MSWRDRYRFKLYIRHSIWIFPALSIVAGLIAVILLHRIERTMGWELTVSQETARLVMSTVATSMFTLVVVGSSAVLLIVQLAWAFLWVVPRPVTFASFWPLQAPLHFRLIGSYTRTHTPLELKEEYEEERSILENNCKF